MEKLSQLIAAVTGLLLIQLLPFFPPTSSSLPQMNHPRGMAGWPPRLGQHKPYLYPHQAFTMRGSLKAELAPCALCAGVSSAKSAVTDEASKM